MHTLGTKKHTFGAQHTRKEQGRTQFSSREELGACSCEPGTQKHSLARAHVYSTPYSTREKELGKDPNFPRAAHRAVVRTKAGSGLAPLLHQCKHALPFAK